MLPRLRRWFLVAGPSEILIVNDGSGNPRHLAADLLSQAEHDELASSVLVTTCEEMAIAVQAEVENQLELLPRNAIARSSIENYGAIIVADHIDQALELCNRIATEHLELAVDNPPFRSAGASTSRGCDFYGSLHP